MLKQDGFSCVDSFYFIFFIYSDLSEKGDVSGCIVRPFVISRSKPKEFKNGLHLACLKYLPYTTLDLNCYKNVTYVFYTINRTVKSQHRPGLMFVKAAFNVFSR